MPTNAEVIYVPLKQLQLSPKNSRKIRTEARIRATWESLKAHGQLQNLVATRGQDGEFLIDAGGTRLLAFQHGLKQGEISDDHQVLIKVIPDVDALESSTAENTMREEMHPADQFRSFKRLVDEGRSIASIAARFCIAESVVLQRLKLANVAPELFKLYEDGEMDLNQLQALALTDDHDAQQRAWFGVKGAKVSEDWQREPHQLRKRITAKEVGPDNPLVNFVGADLYESAGGQVRRDLFSSSIYFSDDKLLRSLAAKKLDALVLQEQNDGWSWVEGYLEMDHGQRYRYNRGPFHASERKLAKEEADRHAFLRKRLTELHDILEDGDDVPDAAALETERDQLQAEFAQLEASREIWPADAKAKTGVLIFLDRYDGLQILRGYVKPGQKVKTPTDAKAKAGTSQKAELSSEMDGRLQMHRAAATRVHIAARPDAALALLLSHFLSRLFVRDISSTGLLLDMSVTDQHREAGRTAEKYPDLAKAPARKALDDQINAWKKAGLPTKATEMFSWVIRLDKGKQIELLALATAMSLATNHGAKGQAVAEQFEVDMTQWWSPSAENFLTLVPKAVLAQAATEAAGKATGQAILGMKRDAAAVAAGKALAGTGWLPKPLRGSAYKVGRAEPGQAAVAPKGADKAGTKGKSASKAARKASTKAAAAKKPAKAPAKKATKALSKKASPTRQKAGVAK